MLALLLASTLAIGYNPSVPQDTTPQDSAAVVSQQAVHVIERVYEQHVTPGQAHRIAVITVDESQKQGVDVFVTAAIIITESNVHILAKGLAGEIGLAQINPKYWRGRFPECGSNLWNPRTNICYETHIIALCTNFFELSQCIIHYNGQKQFATVRNSVYAKKVNGELGALYLVQKESK